MAQVGDVYVSSVTYSAQLLPETDNLDLTKSSSNGVSFLQVPNTTGLLNDNQQTLYEISITFNPTGVDSLSSIIINNQSNVNGFRVEFFAQPGENQVFTIAPNLPLSYNSIMINSEASIVDFPPEVPSPLNGIRISILSTTDAQ